MNDISYSQMRIVETAESFRQLYKIYSKNSREKISCIQLKEMADLLEEVAGVDINRFTPDGKAEKKLKKSFLEAGIILRNVIFYRTRNGKLEISAKLKTQKHICLCTGAAAEIFTSVCGRRMVPDKDGRIVITDIERDFIFEEAAVYYTLSGVAAASREKGIISGDSYAFINPKNENMCTILCDGMGTGNAANRTSSMTVELICSFLEAGFSEKNLVGIINAALASKEDEDPVTVDIMSLNLMTGIAGFIKAGAASSFIKSEDDVKVIKPSSLPAGMLSEINPDYTSIKLNENNYVIMVSDGVMDALPFYDKEQHMAEIINELPMGNPKMMAGQLMDELMFYRGINVHDDMTILVTGMWKSQNV